MISSLLLSLSLILQINLPPSEIVYILESLGWSKFHAHSISRIPAYYDSNLTAIGYYYGGCKYGRVVIRTEPTVPGRAYHLEHEYHHAWDDCNKLLGFVREDAAKLLFAEAQEALKTDTAHINHVLISLLNHDYTRLPYWYRAKYFRYSIEPSVIYVPLGKKHA